MRGLFITGTDTGVGKTAVTSAAVRWLRTQKLSVGAYKPAASGSERSPRGEEVWGDVESLFAALGGKFPRERICPQTFAAPLAPPIAAEAEGRQVDGRLLRTGAAWWRDRVEVLLVEGAGGLLSPLSDTESVADLAEDLGFPLLVVARVGLGTINHTLLTIEAARARQLSVAGVVLSEAVPLPETDISWKTNPRELQRRCDVPVLAVVRHVPGGDLLEVDELQRIPWNSLPQPKVSAASQE
jgi:dethiobiotin synthetase